MFFDLDGTLADSLGFLYDCYLWALEDFGKKAPMKEFLQLIEMPYEHGMRLVTKTHGIEDPLSFFQKMFSKGTKEYSQKVSLFPGAKELIETLSKKVDLYLTTSAEKTIAVPYIQNQNLESYFVDIITPEHGSKAKPHPQIYLDAIARSGYKEDVIVVEDSNVGVIAAKKAGLEVVVVEHSHLQVDQENVKKFKNLFALKEWFEQSSI